MPSILVLRVNDKSDISEDFETKNNKNLIQLGTFHFWTIKALITLGSHGITERTFITKCSLTAMNASNTAIVTVDSVYLDAALLPLKFMILATRIIQNVPQELIVAVSVTLAFLTLIREDSLASIKVIVMLQKCASMDAAKSY